MLEENPLLHELFAEKTIQFIQKYILVVLEERFETVPIEAAESIRALQDETALDSCFRFSVVCPSLESFQNRLGLSD